MANTVKKSEADAYHVRVGMDNARIFLEEGVHPSGYRWGYISVVSSFGNFGHFFSDVGEQTFREFLLGVSRDYLMGKFFGVSFWVFDADATIAYIRQYAQEQVREGVLDEFGLESLMRALEQVEANGCQTGDELMLSLSEGCPRECSNLELWSCIRTRPNPQAIGFWETIWPSFCAQLREELSPQVAAAASA